MDKKKFGVLLWIVFLTVFTLPSYAADSDDDGIPNKYDECPKEKEDIDDFEDENGCPDYDNDKDSVPDTKDKCINVSEDLDGFQDFDGCPDPDNDGDGIPDKVDTCPNEKEDFDSFQDTDGCPDQDNDKDGIVDTKDKCTNDSEDQDGFQDTDGCPEFDNDKDGFKDAVDKCPNSQETINGKDDEDGCPDLEMDPVEAFKVYPDVSFRTGTDELTFESQRSLDSLGKKLSLFPNQYIQISLFLPFVSDPEITLNLLSIQQTALINYLVSKGAKEAQIVPMDYSLQNYETVKETEKDFNQTRPMEVYIVNPNEQQTDPN